jgi:hypothetical protein
MINLMKGESVEAPIQDLNRCLAILILKAAGCNNDTVAGVIACAKATVGSVEQWFKQLSLNEAASICYDQSIKNAFWLIIQASEQHIDYNKHAVAAQIGASYLLGHYGKVKAAAKQPPLTPDWHQHLARLSGVAENLRLNVKDIKESKGILIGNVTGGHLQISKNKVQPLRNVDRLDAECLLDHLKATFFHFNDINDWESLTSRGSVLLKVSDSLVKKLKEVSHGLALKGTCKICESWSEAQ